MMKGVVARSCYFPKLHTLTPWADPGEAMLPNSIRLAVRSASPKRGFESKLSVRALGSLSNSAS